MVTAARAAPASLPHLRVLSLAGRRWSGGTPLDEATVVRARTAALLHNHARYRAHIPAYAALAAESGVPGDATLDDIRTGLIVGDELFKSYDPGWLAGDLPAVGRWLRTVSTTRAPDVDAADLDAWRAALKRHGVYITFSSGTLGRPSIVPRDELTLAALRGSSGVRLPWAPRPGAYDCLLLTPPGLGVGIQSGAAGLAAGAAHVHHLRAAPLVLAGLAGRPTQIAEPDAAGVVRFLRAATGAGRPTLLYGSPAELAILLDLVGAAGVPRLAAGSCVVTGGGWKGGSGTDLWALFDAVADRFGVPRDRCVDTYSSAELNTVFVSCRRGRYHVPPVVEVLVLDDQLQPVRDPHPAGRLAVLDPFALSYPGFVATGDLVRMFPDRCACGLPGATLDAPIVRAPGAPRRGCGTMGAR